MSDVTIAIVGAGPTASTLIERIAANAGELPPHLALVIHLIDPQPAGIGRVWRPENSAGLWMNSLAEDVTLFTDSSVVCDGPIRPGPSLIEWAASVDDATLESLTTPELINEIRSLEGTSFPTRRVQSVYLDWFYRRVIATLPPNVTVHVHRDTAVDVSELGDREVVTLESGIAIEADTVVLALGHLDAEPDPQQHALSEFAHANGLTYIRPGHTAELDLSPLEAGAPVIALGFGQAFTDLLVLLTEDRGGRFVPTEDGRLTYHRSGAEPIIHVGSRRGVPYRSKLDYRLPVPLAPLPRFLTEDFVTDLLQRPDRIDFRADLLPTLAKEIGWAYYHQLFHAHPQRTIGEWSEFDAAYAAAETAAALDEVVRSAVPDANDRFDIGTIDRPLDSVTVSSVEAVHDVIARHIDTDLRRRTDDSFSADLAAFHALLQTFATLGRIAASGRVTPRSRVEDISGWWFSFFMYYASGPPPERLRQLLALADAGVVRFIGGGLKVWPDGDRKVFVATSAQHPDEVVAGALIEPQIAAPTISRTADRLLQGLHARGEVLEEIVIDGEWRWNTGKVVVAGPGLQLTDSAGNPHPRRHAVGTFTNRPAAGAFARPRTNAPTFRQNDSIARVILHRLAQLSAEPATAAS